MKQGVDA